MKVEFDNKLLEIDTYYDVKEIQKYFKSNAIILLHESDNYISNSNDKYYRYNNETLEQIKNNKKGFIVQDNKLYFLLDNNENPIENNKKYGLIIFYIASNCNNVSDSKFTFGLNWLDLVTKRINKDIIDSSMIKNKQGTYCIGANHYDRYRSATKVNVIVTSTGIPLSINVVKANIHDSTLTAEAVNCLNVKVIGSRLIADKGYINKKYKKKLKKSQR